MPPLPKLTIPWERVLWWRSAEPTISSSLKAVRLNRTGFQFNQANPSPAVNGLWFATPGCRSTVRKPGAKVKLLLVGVLVGLVIGVALTIFYFSLATFFAVHSKALEAAQKATENRNENAEHASAMNEMRARRVGQGNPGLGRESASPAKDKAGISKGVLR